MRAQANKFEANNCAIVGISFDTPEDNQSFKTQNEFPFPLLSDPHRSVGALYGAVRDADDPFHALPKRISYLIDEDGIILKAYEVSAPADHAADVLADLASS